jgi:hypothetical protein
MPDITATRPAAGAPIETGWGQNVHDTLEGMPYVQSGTASGSTSNASTVDISVTFPRAYASAPHVVCALIAGAITYQASVFSRSATGCVIRCGRNDASNSTQSFTVDWMAVGTLATPF